MDGIDDRLNMTDEPQQKRARGRACPACGGEARRDAARYCATCGRAFAEEGYLPTDALRSSYHQQRVPLPPMGFASHEAKPSRPTERRGFARQLRPSQPRPSNAFFRPRQSGSSSSIALAFVAYALVPYLGILFCPGALLLGGVGLWRARSSSLAGARRTSLFSIICGLIILGVQIFLWWLLYKVPEWSSGGF